MRLLIVGAMAMLMLMDPPPARAQAQSFERFRAAVMQLSRRVEQRGGVRFFRAVRYVKANSAIVVPSRAWVGGPDAVKRRNLMTIYRLWRATGNPCPCVLGVGVPGRGAMMMLLDDGQRLRIVSR